MSAHGTLTGRRYGRSMRYALATGLAIVTAAAGSASAATTPVIRAAGAGSIVVTGVGFAPGERVIVVASGMTRTWKVSTVTSAAGRFRVALRIPERACAASYPIRAVGERGSRARTRAVGRPCIPPPVE